MPEPPPTEGQATAAEIKQQLEKLPLAEKVLAPIALVILVGWIVKWSTEDRIGLLRSWFDTLSFCGALAVTLLVGAKLFGRRPLPAKLERLVVPIASLVPVAGYLFDIIDPIYKFLTVGGSIALAYLSATTYWRRHIPPIVTRPLDTSEPGEEKPE
jgi:hypothetical protein